MLTCHLIALGPVSLKRLFRKNSPIRSTKTILRPTKQSQTIIKKNPISDEQLLDGPFLRMNYKGKNILILGTAHVSQKSVDDVENYIQKFKPHVVAVELCQTRYNSIRDKERWKNLNLVEVIKARKLYMLMASLILSSFQKKMGEQQHVAPGAEMVKAIDLAEQYGLSLALVDRDVQITLRRAWQSMGFFKKMVIISELVTGLTTKADIEDEDLEQMKQKDVLDELFEKLPSRYSNVKEIIITERDKYLAEKIKRTADQNPRAKEIFAVVGAGHLKGIKKFFYSTTFLDELETLKPKKKWVTYLKAGVPLAAILALFSIFRPSWPKVKEILELWIILKCSFAAAVSLILWLHPLSALAAIVTAPISNFNPILKTGWVAAFLEAKFKTPKVEDFEMIAEDSKTFLGFFRNKVLHIFLTFFLLQTASFLASVRWIVDLFK